MVWISPFTNTRGGPLPSGDSDGPSGGAAAAPCAGSAAPTPRATPALKRSRRERFRGFLRSLVS
jgi:hypothetical protein